MGRRIVAEPTVNDCRDLAYRFRQSGVLLLTIGGGKFAVTSYGADRRRCDALRKVNDFITDAIERGEIDLGAFREKES